MSSKRYIVWGVSVLYMFIRVNLVLWHGAVKAAFRQRDLNRLGSMATTDALTEEVHYSLNHAELADYIGAGTRKSFDVLTIGDSFSNG